MGVAVREFAAALASPLRLELVAGGQGLDRVIEAPRVQKPALALAGYMDQLHSGRVQVFGNAEVGYLQRLPPAEAIRAADRVARAEVACFVVANANPVPASLRRAANRARRPLFSTSLRTAVLIRGVTHWLEDRLAPETWVHGVLVEVLGVGVLVLGKSGIGKSEAGLALVARGQRLVADDVVVVREAPAGVLRGRCTDQLRHHIEIRGLGVLDVAQLFGTLATASEARVDLVVELVEPDVDASPDRLGIDEQKHALLGVEVPYLAIQVRPGRDLATIIEVATRNHLLKLRGIHSALALVRSIEPAPGRTRARQAARERAPRRGPSGARA